MKQKNTTKVANALLEMHWTISERAMNVLLYLLQKATVEQSLTETPAPLLYIDRRRLAEVANLNGHNGRLMPIFEELATTRFIYDTKEHKLSAPILSAYQYDEKTDIITIEFARLLWPYLCEVVVNFTVVDLGVFWFVAGKYAKRFYLDVMRWKSTGELILNVENMQERYKMPYLYADIQRRVVQPAIDQIHALTNVKIAQLPPRKEGKKVISLRFVVHRPSAADMAPWAAELVRKYKFSTAFAGMICQRMTARTINEICAAIDEAAQARKINNLAAYAATYFRNYGLQPKEPTHAQNNAGAGATS